MTEEVIMTGGPVLQAEGPRTETNRGDSLMEIDKQIVLNISTDGGIRFDFSEEMKTYEVFGALFVSILDLGVQNFINPNLSVLMESGSNGNKQVLESIRSLASVIAGGAGESPTRKSDSGIIEAIEKALIDYKRNT